MYSSFDSLRPLKTHSRGKAGVIVGLFFCVLNFLTVVLFFENSRMYFFFALELFDVLKHFTYFLYLEGKMRESYCIIFIHGKKPVLQPIKGVSLASWESSFIFIVQHRYLTGYL